MVPKILQGNGLVVTMGKLEAGFMLQHLEDDCFPRDSEDMSLLTLNLAQNPGTVDVCKHSLFLKQTHVDWYVNSSKIVSPASV